MKEKKKAMGKTGGHEVFWQLKRIGSLLCRGEVLGDLTIGGGQPQGICVNQKKSNQNGTRGFTTIR